MEPFFDVLVGTDSLRDCSIKASFPELSEVKSEEFGEELSEIAHDVGLKRVLSCPSRFDILYQDWNDFQPNCGIAELVTDDSRLFLQLEKKKTPQFPFHLQG